MKSYKTCTTSSNGCGEINFARLFNRSIQLEYQTQTTNVALPVCRYKKNIFLFYKENAKVKMIFVAPESQKKESRVTCFGFNRVPGCFIQCLMFSQFVFLKLINYVK